MTTAVLICPGRGTYNKEELGYLGRRFPDRELFSRFDRARSDANQETLSALDGAERFSTRKHTRGDNASALIYAATLGDRMAIDDQRVDLVAVTGNSMGWYSALACAGALTAEDGFKLANTMGAFMQETLIGGQLIYPFVSDEWIAVPGRKQELLGLVAEIDARPNHVLRLSIDLGGMLVIAGDEAGLSAFEARVPRVQDRFPMRLPNHAAFHTHLQAPVAEMGRARLGSVSFSSPDLPMIDGRGAIWWPGATDPEALRTYTLGHQVTETYDFTAAVTVAAREFAPDLFIITGPGTTLGGAVAQSLIGARWRGMTSKTDFQLHQNQAPILAAMGLETQRALAINGRSQ